MGEKPYWAGTRYWIEPGMDYCLNHTGCGPGYKPLAFYPHPDCAGCRWAIIENEKKGLIVPPERNQQEVMKNTNVALAGGAKYSFVGRPDFARIIRENEGADVIIVSREDEHVVFMFSLGTNATVNPFDGNTFRIAEKACGIRSKFQLCNDDLPDGWFYHATSNIDDIKDLRRIAQEIVRVRTGKHTVEVLP